MLWAAPCEALSVIELEPDVLADLPFLKTDFYEVRRPVRAGGARALFGGGCPG
jgi:hypothetical protein